MKRLLSLVVAGAMLIGTMTACGSSTQVATKAPETTKAPEKVEETKAPNTLVPEVKTIRWNYGTSGNILVSLAEEKGYFDEYGIKIEPVQATEVSSAMTLLSTGQVDVVSNSGTSNPLQQIASGVDMTIFGGHMVTGCMPVVAKKGTKWEGIKSVVGKKFACNPSYFAFTGAVMDLGYDNPLEVVDWVVIPSYNDALAAVVKGEVDFAMLGTGLNEQAAKNPDIDIVSYQSEVMPNYSCCRMECQTDFLKKNPNTIKAILICLLRAQAYYENHKDESVKLLAKTIGATDSYVAAYMLDDKHYVVNADPLRNSVVRAWNILDRTGFLNEKAKTINIEDHINTSLYEEALEIYKEKYGNEAPGFYEKQVKFYNENNK